MHDWQAPKNSLADRYMKIKPEVFVLEKLLLMRLFDNLNHYGHDTTGYIKLGPRLIWQFVHTAMK